MSISTDRLRRLERERLGKNKAIRREFDRQKPNLLRQPTTNQWDQDVELIRQSQADVDEYVTKLMKALAKSRGEAPRPKPTEIKMTIPTKRVPILKNLLNL